MNEQITIVDPRPIAKANPMSYYVPCDKRLQAVTLEDYVKMVFEIKDGSCPSERMWVKVTGSTEDGRLIGTLENNPYYLPMEYGEQVIFDRYAIIDIETNREDDPEETNQIDERNFHRCWIDKRVNDGEIPAARASNMHEAPENFTNTPYPWGGWMIVGADWEEGMPLEIGTPILEIRKEASFAQFVSMESVTRINLEKVDGIWQLTKAN